MRDPTEYQKFFWVLRNVSRAITRQFAELIQIFEILQYGVDRPSREFICSCRTSSHVQRRLSRGLMHNVLFVSTTRLQQNVRE